MTSIVQGILQDRELEENAFYIPLRNHRHSSTQTEQTVPMTNIVTKYTQLKNVFDISKEISKRTQKQYIIEASHKMYSQIATEIVQLEKSLGDTLDAIRSDCGRQLENALIKVKDDHDRYDEYILNITEEKFTTQGKPLEALYDTAFKSLRKKTEEFEKLKFDSCRLGLLLKKTNTLSKLEISKLEEEKPENAKFIEKYQGHVAQKDEEIRLLNAYISELQETKEALRHAIQESAFEEAAQEKVVKSNEPEKSQDEVMAEQFEKLYSDQEKLLVIEQSKELAMLEKHKEIVEQRWKTRIESAQFLQDSEGTAKVLHRQERILTYLNQLKVKRPPADKEITAHLSGFTYVQALAKGTASERRVRGSMASSLGSTNLNRSRRSTVSDKKRASKPNTASGSISSVQSGGQELSKEDLLSHGIEEEGQGEELGSHGSNQSFNKD